MTYLGRPIFDLPLDWLTAITRQAAYDLRTQQIGFGAAVNEHQQAYSANAYSAGLDLPDACSINALERFVQGVRGRLQGFWLATPERYCEIIAGVSATQFQIAAQGLVDTWAQDPCIYLAFYRQGSATQYSAVSAVAAVDANTELVTVSAAMATPVDASWEIEQLRYVRLTADDLQLQFYAESAATCALKVLELPVEYASVELGERPAFGYHFWRLASGAQEDWYYTSFDQVLYVETSPGVQVAHTPAPISHGDVQSSVTGTREQLQIDTWRFGSPLDAFMPFAPQYDLFVEVHEVDLGAGDPAAGSLLFSGLVETVEPTGRSLKVICSSRIDLLNASLPRPRIQKTCNNVLYGASCKASRAAFSFTATVAGIDALGLSILLAATGIGDKASGWFAFGDALSHDSAGLPEYRTIVGSTTSGTGTGQHSIQLSAPFSRLPVIGDTLVVAAGCDLGAGTCATKFANFDNFFGHPFIDTNLSLVAVKLNTAQSGKGGGK